VTSFKVLSLDSSLGTKKKYFNPSQDIPYPAEIRTIPISPLLRQYADTSDLNSLHFISDGCLIFMNYYYANMESITMVTGASKAVFQVSICYPSFYPKLLRSRGSSARREGILVDINPSISEFEAGVLITSMRRSIETGFHIVARRAIQ
jgi:hypothetical protein